MNEPSIREVTAADVGECHRIESLCFPPDEAASKERIRQRQQTYPEGFLVAEVDGRIAGLINSGASHEPDLADEELKGMTGHDPRGRHLVVFSLAVDPAYQRRGIARSLLSAFVERGRAHSKVAVLLLCKKGLISFYQRLGFDDLGPSASSHGGCEWHEMRRRL